MLDFSKYKSRSQENDGENNFNIGQGKRSGSVTMILDGADGKYENGLQPLPSSSLDLSVPSRKHRLQSWQDSAPVSRLIIYLKEHGSSAGIKLRKTNGTPRLSFDPGLGLEDVGTERWRIANNATALLIDAVDDLKYLIAHGRIKPPGEVQYGS